MEIARHWRLNNQRYKLQGSVCACCGKAFFAPRPVCDACSREESPTLTLGHSAIRHDISQPVAVGK